MDKALFGELRAALNNHEEIPQDLLHLEEARTYIVEHIANLVATIMCDHPPDASHRYGPDHIMWCWYSVDRGSVPRSLLVGRLVRGGGADDGFGFMAHTGCGELPPGVSDAFDRLCGVLYELMPLPSGEPYGNHNAVLVRVDPNSPHFDTSAPLVGVMWR